MGGTAAPWTTTRRSQDSAASPYVPYGGDYEKRPWYKRRLVWAGVLLLVAIAIAVPVAVEVVNNNKEANRYPNYTKLNYALTESYSGSQFFDKFNYYSDRDKSNGFVQYTNQSMAQQLNLTYATPTTAILRVDTSITNTTSIWAGDGRYSARVESKSTYNGGLFLFDVKHTPTGCGTWPALWLTDTTNNAWPAHGEIDVLEAVNQGTAGNQVTLHTNQGCSVAAVRRVMTGRAASGTDCPYSAADTTGCAVAGGNDTYGPGFNANGGGVMALEWRAEGIRVWEFARAVVPADITAGAPDPSSWGEPLADFPNTQCDIAKHFVNQSIIMNINVCGDWVYGVYASSGCPSDCKTFVAENPQALTDAYWEVGSFQVYQAA